MVKRHPLDEFIVLGACTRGVRRALEHSTVDRPCFGGDIFAIGAAAFRCGLLSVKTHCGLFSAACDGIWDVMSSEEVASYARVRTMVGAN